MSAPAISARRLGEAAEAVAALLALDDDAVARVEAALEVALLDRAPAFPTLPPGEGRFLAALIAANGRTVSFDALLGAIGSDAEPKLSNVYVRRLRIALGLREWIVSVHNCGYRWAGPDLAQTRRRLLERAGAAA